MPTKKLNAKEWAKYIELEHRNKELKKQLAAKNAREKKRPNPLAVLKTYVPGAIGLGLIAMVTMFFWFGWKVLLETVLSWIIGITIVTTYVATVSSVKNGRK